MDTLLDQDYLQIIQAETARFQLDLSGMTVLTEVASGFYSCTPLVAALSGANVITFGKDSQYGTFKENKYQLEQLSNQLGLSNKIRFINSFAEITQCEVDLITNCGMLRPINSELLSKLSQNAIVSYMCENWEVREGDVDLGYCDRHNIPVLFTDEGNEGAQMFQYCGDLAVKLVKETGAMIESSKIFILSSDKFGIVIKDALLKAGAHVVFNSDLGLRLPENIKYDQILVADYTATTTIIGGLIDIDILKRSLKEDGTVIQFAGANDLALLKQNNIEVYPIEQVQPQRMARTLSYLGALPVVRLQAAGLKVGQVGVTARRLNLIGSEFDNYILKNSPAQLPLRETA